MRSLLSQQLEAAKTSVQVSDEVSFFANTINELAQTQLVRLDNPELPKLLRDINKFIARDFLSHKVPNEAWKEDSKILYTAIKNRAAAISIPENITNQIFEKKIEQIKDCYEQLKRGVIINAIMMPEEFREPLTKAIEHKNSKDKIATTTTRTLPIGRYAEQTLAETEDTDPERSSVSDDGIFPFSFGALKPNNLERK